MLFCPQVRGEDVGADSTQDRPFVEDVRTRRSALQNRPGLERAHEVTSTAAIRSRFRCSIGPGRRFVPAAVFKEMIVRCQIEQRNLLALSVAFRTSLD